MTTPRPPHRTPTPLPHEDLTAAMAARRELGPEYDEAFLETVVARIEESLDSRTAPKRPARRPGPGGSGDLALALLSLAAAIPLSAIAVVNAGLPGLAIVCAAIVLVNLTYVNRPRR